MYKLFILSGMIILTACSGNRQKSETAAPDSTQVAEGRKFACPMRCEGDKTYAEAGKCPVCKMELQEVALAETDSTEHIH
ncbi:hypothetical protein DYBT9275_00546 [Dyadobacter sp. CECT 9275]|uniref:Heavy metal binding domain-containing protein n=1 Tax=Dyadobacter helix TaxID=2822344 RepID=A0A916NAX3_9BACT|nr:heavy metal-binding domain-containing protein [Dyadobacter sp. CECT 9275]CAG4990517.1 hypothetical protein DYBT9275_00546 [Dyadobacter sp. CECT 9275]